MARGTDWQDEVLRNAIQQTHELSINGGTEKNRYAFSANYTDQDGIILNSGFERYNFHVNTEWELQKDLHFGVNVTYGRSKQSGLTTAEAKVFNSSPFSAGITNSFVYAVFFEVSFCHFVIFGHKKSVSLRNAFVYAKCPVSLWHIVSVRNMQPDAISVPLANALVKVVH